MHPHDEEATGMDRETLQELLAGKIIARAELSPGAVVLHFADGTRLVKEKTFEGLNEATLYGPAGETIAAVVLG